MGKKPDVPPADDVKMCNCAGCGKEMLGESMAMLYSQLPRTKQDQLGTMIGGRILGRPYCLPCLTTTRKRGKPGLIDFSPWDENATRTSEGD
jgi:hypothetical protein